MGTEHGNEEADVTTFSTDGPDSLVIVPTYNEAENLEPLVRQVLRRGLFDVLVVDDHSPDGTGQIADNLASRFPGRVRVQHRIRKLGLGTAYLQGFRYALNTGYDRVFQMDADFSHDPSYLPELRGALDHADVVLGSRYAPGGGTRNRSAQRQMISRWGSRFAGMVLGLPIQDLTGGFKGFRRPALRAINLDGIRSTGFAFQIEVTYRCRRRDLRIVEIPIVFEDRRRGHSKMSAAIVAEAFFQVWRLRLAPETATEPAPGELVYHYPSEPAASRFLEVLTPDAHPRPVEDPGGGP